ncbi:hypothetical protein Tco_1390377, partial [Tanacetum coccineum]
MRNARLNLEKVDSLQEINSALVQLMASFGVFGGLVQLKKPKLVSCVGDAPYSPTTFGQAVINNIQKVENQTLQKHIIPTLLPFTPYTPSAPMQRAMMTAIKEIAPEEVFEYHFQERRVGFVLPGMKTLTEVGPFT